MKESKNADEEQNQTNYIPNKLKSFPKTQRS